MGKLFRGVQSTGWRKGSTLKFKNSANSTCQQKEPPQHSAVAEQGAGEGGPEAARPALNMGKFGERGRQVKKSQQESSLDDRRNLISKIHKSSSEGSRIMGTKEVSVRVNTDLLLAIKWIGPSC